MRTLALLPLLCLSCVGDWDFPGTYLGSMEATRLCSDGTSASGVVASGVGISRAEDGQSIHINITPCDSPPWTVDGDRATLELKDCAGTIRLVSGVAVMRGRNVDITLTTTTLSGGKTCVQKVTGIPLQQT